MTHIYEQLRSLRQKLDARAKLLQELPSNRETQAATLKKEIESLINQYNLGDLNFVGHASCLSYERVDF
ncbi:MAG: hypothetical protein V7K64_08825 [Nostoc sp.]|uniref:hypothetical protein n=1 Tax=unclassified Nostoc TaxID=2593658 RepID=UPI001DCA73F8|nr:hypothetical protein [Nostoc sp. JL34]MBN3886262.1 hypothetical protein [Nostoc sp. JL34]